MAFLGRKVSLTSLDILYVLYLVLTTTILFSFYFLSHYSQAIWLLLAGIPLISLQEGHTLFRRMGQILLFGSLFILVVLITDMLSNSPLLVAIYLMLLAIVTTQLMQSYREYCLQFAIVVLLALFSLSFPANAIESTQRFVYMSSAVIVVMLCQLLYAYHFEQNQLINVMKQIMSGMQGLNEKIFSCYLSPEYPDNLYLFERRIHMQKKKIMQALLAFNCYVDQQKKKITVAQKHRLDYLLFEVRQLFNMLIDCAQLRRRVKDHTIFLLCTKELKQIENGIKEAFENLFNCADDLFIPGGRLDESILTLEALFQHVIKVAERDPSVFLFFIYTLKNMSLILADLHKNLK